MTISKVNNFLNFIFYRYFASLITCFFTFYLTGKIGDMEYLGGFVEFNAAGSRTLTAKKIFSALSYIENKFTLIILLTFLSSLILYFLLNKFLDKNNSFYWYLSLIIPGVLIYPNVPTKELLFFYPAVLYAILECDFLLREKDETGSVTILKSIFKYILLFFMIIIRGTIGSIYLFFSILIFTSKIIYFGKYNKRVKVINSIIISLLLSVIMLMIVSNLYPLVTEKTLEILTLGFQSNSILTRSYINSEFLLNPINILRIQYLSLFPTIEEIIAKPYSLVIFFESLIYIFLYFKIWKNLFKKTNIDKHGRKVIYILFIFITCSYFLMFGYVGALNLGSSQRFKVNFVPLGLFFPLILEKSIRNRLELKKIT